MKCRIYLDAELVKKKTADFGNEESAERGSEDREGREGQLEHICGLAV